MTSETRLKIERQIAEMKKRLAIDSNDLDYETHLHTIRTLEKILAKDLEKVSSKNH